MELGYSDYGQSMPDAGEIRFTAEEYERARLAAEKSWESLGMSNDYVFCRVLQDAEVCRRVLEVILGVEIKRVEYVGRQEVLDHSPDAKSVRLDVFVEGGDGTAFDVEMQACNTGELSRRARYYHAMMAANQLDRGESYARLADSWVIFVCSFDPFDHGRRVYSFENVCLEETDLPLDDGARTVFLSTTAPSIGTPVDEFLDFVGDGTVSGQLSGRLQDRVRAVLSRSDWKEEYMLLEVRDQLNRQAAEEIGEKRGIEIGEKRGIEKAFSLMSELLRQGRISDVLRLSEDLEYRNDMLESRHSDNISSM